VHLAVGKVEQRLKILLIQVKHFLPEPRTVGGAQTGGRGELIDVVREGMEGVNLGAEARSDSLQGSTMRFSRALVAGGCKGFAIEEACDGFKGWRCAMRSAADTSACKGKGRRQVNVRSGLPTLPTRATFLQQ
jgi:hypothetical protein